MVRLNWLGGTFPYTLPVGKKDNIISITATMAVHTTRLMTGQPAFAHALAYMLSMFSPATRRYAQLMPASRICWKRMTGHLPHLLPRVASPMARYVLRRISSCSGELIALVVCVCACVLCWWVTVCTDTTALYSHLHTAMTIVFGMHYRRA